MDICLKNIDPMDFAEMHKISRMSIYRNLSILAEFKERWFDYAARDAQRYKYYVPQTKVAITTLDSSEFDVSVLLTDTDKETIFNLVDSRLSEYITAFEKELQRRYEDE